MAIAQEVKEQEGNIINNALFYFASFGAASGVAFLVAFFLQMTSQIVGAGLSTSSTLWIFLFLFPGSLAISTLFISGSLGVKKARPLYGVIAGYGVYSVSSLLIMVFSGQTDPMSWFVLILALITLAVFYFEVIFSQKTEVIPFESGERTASKDHAVEQKEVSNAEVREGTNIQEKKAPILLISPPQHRKQK